MPYPAFYDPQRVGSLSIPRAAEAIAASKAARVGPAAQDDRRLLLLLIDAQVDFVHPDGALSVPGAVEDARRTAEWIFGHAGEITAIAASLDSHVPVQIFFPTWWVNDDGEHPEPFTSISSGEVAEATWHPIYMPEWSASYVERLEEEAKKGLIIWPYHTLLGTPGHALTPALSEAVAYHAAARQTNPQLITKGLIPQTEFYSLLEPEVKVEDDPRGRINENLLNELLEYDLIYVAGQAKSHCVLESVTSIIRHRPDAVVKIRLLEDCTSSVEHAEIDFEATANEAYTRFEGHGLRRVNSSDPID